MVDAEQSRRAVLDAALELAASDGLGAVTIGRLTSTSGVSNGSIYHHFGSREGVLRHLVVECFADLVDAMAPALDDRDAQACVRDLVGRHLAWAAREPGRAAVLYGAPLEPAVRAGDAVAAELAQRKAAVALPLAGWFGQRMAAGQLRTVPAWAVDPIVLGPVHEAVRRGLTGPDVERAVADAVWGALAPDRC